MLIPRSASVWNICAAIPAFERMPIPTALTFTTSVSVLIVPKPIVPFTFSSSATACSSDAFGTVKVSSLSSPARGAIWMIMSTLMLASASGLKIAATVPVGQGKLLFMGHWGYQWYMEKIGATVFDGHRTAVKAGDWIVMSLNNYGLFAMPRGKVETFDDFAIATDPWISTSNGVAGSGFYFAGNTLLPFIVSPAPPETFVIYHVIDAFAQPGEFTAK